eukprot:Clim_evm6s55 gene=Clim_evmTU6s55
MTVKPRDRENSTSDHSMDLPRFHGNGKTRDEGLLQRGQVAFNLAIRSRTYRTLMLVIVATLFLFWLLSDTSKAPRPETPERVNKRVLVTGAAGFIGMHLSLRLKRQGDYVVGLDNFNDYYDQEIKRERAFELYKAEIRLARADVCDAQALIELIDEHKITHITHLAAQAGVRYSLENPGAYIRSNITCFVTLLEVLRMHFPNVILAYASSSSVYGTNEKVPFSTSDRVDKPASLYGATKRSNELMAHVYHDIYKLKVSGLRFFTVYGPFGRPDMAIYKFTENILSKKPIPVFEGGKLQRDFTYVDDIVQGIEYILDLGAEEEVFNLGKGNPERVTELISLIEERLGEKAEIDWKPFQPGDVPITYADTTKTYQLVSYTPGTTLRSGLHKYVDWHKEFRQRRNDDSWDEHVKQRNEQLEAYWKDYLGKDSRLADDSLL